ncbi:hypothetical protein [Neisseria sp.]|uniref:hypothetical protein n=1 Tax=Neisseria sp. TaxID=192066 RepID=UPI0035A12BF5
MNGWLIAAGLLILLAQPVHMFIGDKEYRRLRPERDDTPHFAYWLCGRASFQMVSADLLLSGGCILLTGLDLLPYSTALIGFFTLLYAAYAVFWFGTLAVSRAPAVQYGKQGQWLLFCVITALLVSGIKTAA